MFLDICCIILIEGDTRDIASFNFAGVYLAGPGRSETIAVCILKDVDFNLLIRIAGSEMGRHIKIL